MDSLSEHSDYGDLALTEGELDPDPLAQFARWLDEAERAGMEEPNAMVVGTVDPDGMPSSRTVLLRGVDARGFAFYSNYESRKGLALASAPVASLLFPWYLLHRQVIVQGTVTRLSAAESDAYFASRPRGSRIAAIVSQQSQPLVSRADLECGVEDLEHTLSRAAADGTDAEPDRPPNWGGYLVSPRRIEFWKGRTSRLHDRLVYTRTPGIAATVTPASAAVDARPAGDGPAPAESVPIATPGWIITRLQP